MAFTESQRVEIRRYLGHQALFRQTDSKLERSMNAVDTYAETETSVEARLAELAAIETKVTACYSRLKALKVGAIELPGRGELLGLLSEGRRITRELAVVFGVDVLEGAVFGGGKSVYGSYMQTG